MITASSLFSFFSFSLIPANNSDADGSVAHRPDPRETQCVPAVCECLLKKRRRTGGSDSTFDEARDITSEEEEDFPDDVSDEPQDTLCTLCGVFFCEEENGACDHCRTCSPDNSESPFNLSECAVVAGLLEGSGEILYVDRQMPVAQFDASTHFVLQPRKGVPLTDQQLPH